MASQILFKMACPSCDAQVPIRDPRLLGKKVECPKCKYRFVVEEPGSGFEAVEDDTEPAGKGKAKGKAKKSGGNSTLYIGLGVGGVAVAVLGVVGWLMMSSGGEPPKPAPISKPPLAVNKAAEDTSVPPANAGETAPAEAKTDNPPATTAANTAAANVTPVPARDTSGDISNLLPNDSFLVVNVNLEKLRFSAIGEQMFESKVGFRPNAFKEKIGIAIDEMKRLVRGENTEQKWSFNIIRTQNPINFEEVKKVLKVEKGPKSPIKGRDYYQIPPNDLLDHLTDALKSDLENREARMTRRDDAASPLGIALVDETTVVIANLDPLQEFLQAGGKPRRLSKPGRAVGEDGQPTPGADAPGGNPAPPPKRGSSAAVQFSTLFQLPQAPGGTDDAVLTENDGWLTIEPALKAMIERLEDGKRDHLITVAVDIQKDPKLVERIRSLSGIRDIPAAQLQIFGVTLQHYNLEKFWSTVAVQFFRENDAKGFEDALKKILPNLARGLGLFLGGIRIETEGADSSAANPSPNQPQPSDSGTGAGLNLPGFLTAEDGPASKLILNRRGRYLTVKAELNLVERAYNRIYEMTLATVTRMRGMVDMASPLPHWKELTAAAEQLHKETGVIPPGTFPVGESTGGRLARVWPPHQRVGWMARLLPYLNQDDLFRSIKHDKFWKTDANLKAGSILIPTFLDPRYPDTSWYARLDALGNKVLGSTHFVGCAGIGLEAGDYKADDPAVAKKLGAFGYDRKTAIKDVTDGLANTIYMIQVPPGYQRPWIAGGGATVMGVPETKSIRPFEYSHQGKRGAIVLMLDGSVRIVDANVKDDVFKALATIKGGETIDNLDAVAPKVKTPKAPELKTDTAESSSN